MRELEAQFKALGNKRRLEILRIIKENNQMSVGDIALRIRLSFKSTSRHLAVLSSVGAISKEQVGLTVFCKLAEDAPRAIKQAIGLL